MNQAFRIKKRGGLLHGVDEESSLKEETFFIYWNGYRALSVIACNPPIVNMDCCDFDLIASIVVYQ